MLIKNLNVAIVEYNLLDEINLVTIRSRCPVTIRNLKVYWVQQYEIEVIQLGGLPVYTYIQISKEMRKKKQNFKKIQSM